jgi:hypothetical protein
MAGTDKTLLPKAGNEIFLEYEKKEVGILWLFFSL